MSIESREHTLDNGLRVVAEVDPTAASAAAGFFVRTGARDEEPRHMGISHFLEHMVFRGTEGLDGEAIDRAFESLGASHNAWTSSEVTAFHGHALAESLDEMLDLLARIMRPTLDDDDLHDERSVVLEEIAMYEDQPFSRLWEKVTEAYYGRHPMGHRVLGTVDSVNAIAPDDMRNWHEARYGSDCITLSLAGRLEFDAVVDRMQETIGRWTPTGARRSWGHLEHHRSTIEITSDRTNQAYFIALAPAPPLEDRRRHAAAVLAWLAGRGDGSALHWALVDTGIAEDARLEYEGHDRSGVFAAWSVCEPSRLDEVESTIRKVVLSVAETVDEEDLARARSMIATAVTVHGELPAGRMQRLGRRVAVCGDVLPLEEELARVEAITREDLRELVDAYPPELITEGRLVPEFD